MKAKEQVGMDFGVPGEAVLMRVRVDGSVVVIEIPRRDGAVLESVDPFNATMIPSPRAPEDKPAALPPWRGEQWRRDRRRR